MICSQFGYSIPFCPSVILNDQHCQDGLLYVKKCTAAVYCTSLYSCGFTVSPQLNPLILTLPVIHQNMAYKNGVCLGLNAGCTTVAVWLKYPPLLALTFLQLSNDCVSDASILIVFTFEKATCDKSPPPPI